MQNPDRYLKIVKWALRRYAARRAGKTIYATHIGFHPTRYTLIEELAFARYMGVK